MEKIYTFNGYVTKQLNVVDTTDRIFEGIVTAEMVDKQGEITIRDELLKLMPIWMKRGGTLNDTHSNRHCGKGLNYAPVDIIDKDGTKYIGIKITGQIFKDSALDDMVWKAIVDGTYKGLSFGGATLGDRIPIKQKDGSLAYQLQDLELYEISVCPEPAVPLSVITDFNKLAKSVSFEEMNNMNLTKRDGNNVVVKCDKTVCYVVKSMEGSDILNRGIDTKIVMTDKDDKKDEKDMEKEKSLTTSKKEDTKDEDKKESKDDKESKEDKEKSTSALEQILNGVSELTKSIKTLNGNQDTISKQLEGALKDIEGLKVKANETPRPAQENVNGGEVKLNNAYGISNSIQGGEKHADEAEKDRVKLEEKSEKVDLTKSANISESTTGRAGTGSTNVAKAFGGKTMSPVLKMAREVGGQHLEKVVEAINNGTFGNFSGTDNQYPEV